MIAESFTRKSLGEKNQGMLGFWVFAQMVKIWGFEDVLR